MTPKQKAEELVTRYRRCLPMNLTTVLDAKKCALIAVDEVLGYMGADRGYEFWTKVKNEIQKL